MIVIAVRTAVIHQEALRAEAARQRAASAGSAVSLLARVASIARSAFGGPQIAPGSVFPATH